MPPRLNVLSLTRAIPYRPKAQTHWGVRPQIRAAPAPYRAFSSARDLRTDAEKEATQPLPHISQEAAKTAEIEGKEGPDLEQGTPVADVSKFWNGFQMSNS